MPWFILTGIGILTGFCISNATMRHHALTLIIWICKSTRYAMGKTIWAAEWTQDKFDDIEMPIPQYSSKNKQQSTAKQTEQPDKEPVFNPDKMTQQEIYDFINKHPEQVHGVKHKGEG
jgi:hypothetical protein